MQTTLNNIQSWRVTELIGVKGPEDLYKAATSNGIQLTFFKEVNYFDVTVDQKLTCKDISTKIFSRLRRHSGYAARSLEKPVVRNQK